jgi:signal transduction histidine kinase
MKLVTVGNPPATAEDEFRQLVSDLFHQLSQPLTTLCCSLELALLQTPTADQYDEIVSQALIQTERASATATAIRELFDAGRVPGGGEILELRRAVEEAIADLLPVAESSGVDLRYLSGPPCRLWFDASRLRQGLFHLFGFVIGSGGAADVVKIALAERSAEVTVVLELSGNGVRASPDETNSDLELLRRLGLGIARAIFEAAGGSVTVEPGAECKSVEVRLPRKLER